MKTVLVLGFCCGMAMASALVTADQEVRTQDFSGYLTNYDQLVFDEDLNAFVFFNEDMRGKYKKVILQSVSLYARDAKADPEVAYQAADYLRDGLEAILAERDLLATEAGPGVLRQNIAITGAEKRKDELSALHVLPVAAIFRGAQAVSGNVATYIDAMFEAELVDSVTGERATAIVRRGIGETEKRSGDSFELEDLIPTLDIWLESYSIAVDEYLARNP